MADDVRKYGPFLRKIYYNVKDKDSYSTPQALYDRVRAENKNITLDQVTSWLKSQDTYTLHKSSLNIFKRNRVVAHYMDEQWDADLVDMQEFREQNKGYNYLLTVVDVLSKYAWAVSLKQKTGKEVVEAFKTIFLSSKRIPSKLRTDRGKEFVNTEMTAFTKEHKINHFFTQNHLKACVAERFNRTLKGKMWKYFSANFTFNYVNIINDLLTSYNSKRHRMIKMAPGEVNAGNQEKVYETLYPEHAHGTEADKATFKVGNYVRVAFKKPAFHKGYTGNYSEEVFKINSINPYGEFTRYYLVDLDGEALLGAHYAQELQSVNLKKNKKFVIEKIIQKRRVRGKIQYFVKWFGYPEKFNSWINNADLSRTRK